MVQVTSKGERSLDVADDAFVFLERWTAWRRQSWTFFCDFFFLKRWTVWLCFAAGTSGAFPYRGRRSRGDAEPGSGKGVHGRDAAIVGGGLRAHVERYGEAISTKVSQQWWLGKIFKIYINKAIVTTKQSSRYVCLFTRNSYFSVHRFIYFLLSLLIAFFACVEETHFCVENVFFFLHVVGDFPPV